MSIKLNTDNIEFSRNLPSTTPIVAKNNGYKRIVLIANEALPLVSMISPQLAYAGNLAGLTIKSLYCFNVGDKFTGIMTAALATGFYTKPLESAQLMHTISAVFNATLGVFKLYKKEFSEAGKCVLSSAYSIVYVGALATANPQLIAISLVGQTAFSFYRAYDHHQKGGEYEAVINGIIGGINGFVIYNQRSNLFVSADKYKAAFIEMKDWAFEVKNHVVNVISEFKVTDATEWVAVQANNCKTTLENVKIEDLKVKAFYHANKLSMLVKSSLNNLLQTVGLVKNQEILKSEKIKPALEEMSHPYVETSLMKATKNADLQEMRMLIQNGADVNAVYGCDWPRAGEPILAYAINSKSLEAVTVLLAAGANPNRFTNASSMHDCRNVPLLAHAIITKAPMSIINELLNNGADPNLLTSYGDWTPLKIAEYHGHTEAVKAIYRSDFKIWFWASVKVPAL